MRIAIVGAGIIGAAIARACAADGHDVTIVDRVGVAAGATGHSFGWVNASFFADAAHFRLRNAGIEAWRRLGLPALRWQGCLWWEEEGAAFDRQVDLLWIFWRLDGGFRVEEFY